MATRTLTTIVSEQDENYILIIDDANFIGSDVLVPNIASLEIEYEGQGGDRFQPILAATINVRIVINSQDLQDLVDDMVGAPEGRFTVRVLRGVALAATVYQVGYVLPDLVTIPDEKIEVGYLFEIRATDGIGRLKTIDYNNNGVAYTGYATFLDHIFNCLNKLPAITALYLSQPFFRAICNWREDSRTFNENDNPLDVTRCNHVAFYTIDSKGNKQFKSCFDVLSEICKGFGARMFFSDGSYWFVQLNEMAVPAGKTIYSYNKFKTKTVLSSQDLRISNAESDLNILAQIKRLSGGVFKFFPALRRMIVNYAHRSTINLIAGEVINSMSSPIQYSTVDSYGGTAKLNYTGTLRIKVDSAVFATFPVFAIFEFTFKVGSNYLSYTGSFAGGNYVFPSASPPAWSATLGTYEYPVEMGVPDYEFVFPISILTPELLADGDLEFSIAFQNLYEADGTVISFASILVSWQFENNYIELLGIGAFSGQSDITEFSATNDLPDNSAEIVVDTTIGDGPGLTSPGHIMVLDDLSVWRLTNAWRVGDSGSYTGISQLLVNEQIRGQLSPVLKYIGSYIKYDVFGKGRRYDPHLVVDWYGRYLLFNGGKISLKDDIVDGEWFQIVLSSNGFTPQLPVQKPADSPASSSPSGSGTNSGSSSGGGSGGSSAAKAQVFQQLFETVTTSSVTITKNAGVLPTNKDAISIFWNGRILKESEFSISGSVITFLFTVRGTNVVNVFFIKT